MISKIPGVGDKIAPALDALSAFQNGMNNTLTLQGSTPANSTNNVPIESMQAIEREKAQQNTETKQRYDINLNAPNGYSMYTPGEEPGLSIQLGVQ